MKKIIVVLVFALFAQAVKASEVQNLSADEALQKLKEGNARFEQLRMKHPDETQHRREELTKGQHPFVAILSCSDSRVPTEIIFDQGLGDIFVIRNAGNVLDNHIMGSIEYAVLHLGIKLVVIMGHQSCGAVAATMGTAKETPAIESLKKSIKPAVKQCEAQHKLTPENVTKTNAQLEITKLLKADSKMKEYQEKHGVKFIPAYYHLDTGKVEFLD